MDKLQSFRNTYCFNKEDIQRDFENYMYLFAPNSEEDYPEEYKNKMFELCKRFQDALNNCSLPQLTDDWWYYDYQQTNDGIDLKLYYCEEFEISEDGEMTSSTSSENFTLLNVKCDYLKVEQFAKNHNITDTTVRQWIRRGKLRTAKKMGRDWLIPSIATKPTRGFTSVSYYWDRLPRALSDSFPFLIGYEAIYIFQNKQDKQQFECILGYPGQTDRKKVVLSTKERERLELALISSSVIQVEEHGWR